MARRPTRDPDLWCLLNVGSTEVPVRFVDEITPPDPDGDDMGEFDPVRNEIRLLRRLLESSSDLNAETVLVHELVHASAFQAAIPNWHDETIVGPLGAALYDCQKRNGLLRFPPIPASCRRGIVGA